MLLCHHFSFKRKGNWKVEGGLAIKIRGEIPAHRNRGASAAEEKQPRGGLVAQSEELGVRGPGPADEKRRRAKNQGHRHHEVRQQHQALPIRDFLRNHPARVDGAVHRELNHHARHVKFLPVESFPESNEHDGNDVAVKLPHAPGSAVGQD